MHTLTSSRPGLRFRERMSGYFHAGANDFEHGWLEGKARGTAMTMSLTVHIPALAELLADPLHRARLTGTVECRALSDGPLRIASGEFRLMSLDAERDGAREMLYLVILVSADGRRFHLHGRKDVHDDPGFDLWADTTTLAVTVRQDGPGTHDEIGRGIVRIGLRDLVRMLASFRVTNARGALEALRTLTRFGLFFGGALLDTYGGRLARALTHVRLRPRRSRA